MKRLLSVIIIGMLATPVAYANHKEGHVGPTTKEVCKTVNGKKQCKTIKVHKKFEGKKVPPKNVVKKRK
jgi:hypothetical protein